MVFRIRHKPTGRFLKKRSSIGASISCILQRDIREGTTYGMGHMYATKKGAEEILRILVDEKYKPLWYRKYPKQPDDWEIVEG